MRLLKLDSGGHISLTGELFEDIPPYAILSHTWGSDDDEVTFNDLNNGSAENKKGYGKIRFCGEQARKNGLEYFWVDTCCIDKAYGPELQEAITSMFRWYRHADQCYAYLSDVSVNNEGKDGTGKRWKPALRKSRWFTRGWTLQELIAPRVVEFFSQEGELLGSKNSLQQLIHEITQIPIEALCGYPLSDFSVNARLRWAENRVTKRQEDRAYSLMGIFDVFMPLIYGEGEHAFVRLQKEIDNLSRTELDEASVKSLKDLKITNPMEDMTRIELSKDRLLDDCCKWILRDPNFQAWHRTDAVPLLWINGDPGKGKTMLMIALARELLKVVSHTSGAVTFFFCQNTDLRLNNAASILRGLIWKLATDHPKLATHIHNRGIIDKQRLSGPNAVVSLFSVLSSMLNDCPRTFILIDALDECNPGAERNQLLSLVLEHSKSSSKAKWLIASRNYPDIKLWLESESRMLSLELNEQHVSNAVTIYIEQKTSDLARMKKYSPDLAEKVKKALTAKADSTFLWVALACKSLLDVKFSRRTTLSALKNLPTGLEALYARMMQQAFQGEDEDEDEGEGEGDDRIFCLRILRSVSLALRPLSQEELITIADLPKELLEDDGLSELVERCGSFILVREHILYFIHQSAKDYLVGRGALDLFPAGLQHYHALTVDHSLDAMSNVLAKDMCDLKHPGSPASKAKLPPQLRAISYACSFWVDHLTNHLGNPTNKLYLEKYLADGGRVHQFLLRHLLHWFEALSALGQIDRGILGLHQLEQVIGHTTSKLPPESTLSHHNFVLDALRVFRQFRPAVEEAPLQVYHSALIFSPENSLVRRKFEEKFPDWIYPVPLIRTEWSPCLQTLEGHTDSIRSVVYSPDGRQLASCSEDKTVRVWDVATGACQYTLDGHTDSVVSVVYSPDGRQLASCSRDQTVRVWDAATGVCQYTLDGHTDWVVSVVYSPDGRQLASCSRDETVRVWDAATGACQYTLDGHTDSVVSVVYSPDGRQLASCSHDQTVRVWDVATGACQYTLDGHTNPVVSVVYSPDGRQLTSCSYDKTVRVWDVATGACQYTLDGHTDWVISVVYSPDGRQLASCSRDQTVRVWDAATGACQDTLDGHMNPVVSVVYSPDGRQLASCSRDETVRVWDAATGACQYTLDGHTDSVVSVVYSPDGRQLASCSHDQTVRVWDVATGACQYTLDGHTNPVVSVVYSPDGRQLTSCSYDKTVRVWDVATGACQYTLDGHTDWVISVVYSPDGRQLASCSHDQTVRVWDVATGVCQYTLDGHTDSVVSVVYSPDGRQLTSCSYDETVRVWDVATGVCQYTLDGHTNPVVSVVYSPDGRQLTSCSYDKTVRVWDVATGACQYTLDGHTDWVISVVYSPDGRQLASCSHDQTVRVWDVATGVCQYTLDGHTDSVVSVVYSPDGRQLTSCSYDETVRVWDVATGVCQYTLDGHTDWVISVVYSPDGRQLASCSYDETVRVWDAATGACQYTLDGHTNSVVSVVYSPDGRQLTSCSYDETVRVWDVATGVCQYTLDGHTDSVISVVYSPDGRQLASCSHDKTVRVWDVATGVCQYTLEAYTSSVAFILDSSALVTDCGVWSISQTPQVGHSPKRKGCGIDNGKRWVTWNGTNMLWIPPEYRPAVSAVKEGRLAIGCKSGVVYILNFCAESLAF